MGKLMSEVVGGSICVCYIYIYMLYIYIYIYIPTIPIYPGWKLLGVASLRWSPFNKTHPFFQLQLGREIAE